MNMNTLITFWGVSALFILTPGADWAYAITAGIRGRVVLPAVFGLLLGHAFTTLIVATGIGAIVSNQPVILQSLTVCGALYLFWVGVGLIVKPSQIAQDQTMIQHKETARHWLFKGICISGLNPKVFLLFFALLPQFIDLSSSFSISTQIIMLGLVHLMTCTMIYYGVGFSSQILLKTRPHAAQRISQISGGLMMVIAILLLVEQLGRLI